MLRRFVSWRAPGQCPGRGEEGVAALEFALIAPLFLVLVFGIIVYGLYFTVWIGATEAASEGARASVAGLSFPESAGYAQSSANSVIAAYGPLMSDCHAPPPTPNNGRRAARRSRLPSPAIFPIWAWRNSPACCRFPATR